MTPKAAKPSRASPPAGHEFPRAPTRACRATSSACARAGSALRLCPQDQTRTRALTVAGRRVGSEARSESSSTAGVRATAGEENKSETQFSPYHTQVETKEQPQ